MKRAEKIFVANDYPIDDQVDEDECWLKSSYHDPYEANGANDRPLIIEHHVLWSMSYGVPVLYFNGWRSGELLSKKEAFMIYFFYLERDGL